MERVPLGAVAIGAVVLPVLLVIGLREPGGTPMRLPVLPRVAAKLVAPTVTTTCMTDDTELVANGDYAMLCWPNGVCGLGGDDVEPRPAAVPVPAITSAIDWRRVRTPPVKTKGWEREGTGEAILPIGDHAIVVRSWDPDTIPPPPTPPSRGTIIDAHGVVTSVIAISSDEPLLSLGDNSYLVFDGAGAFTLVVDGRAAIYGELGAWHTQDAGSKLDVAPGLTRLEGRVSATQAVVLTGQPAREDDGIEGEALGTLRIANVAASWCDDDSCHLTKLMIGFVVDLKGHKRQWIDRSEDHTYPRC